MSKQLQHQVSKTSSGVTAESDEAIYRQQFDDDSIADEDPNAFLDDNDTREQRMVVRFVPKAIDYAIFVIQLTVLGSYFYVAYFYKGLDDEDCKADINSNVPLPSSASNIGINVSKQFKIAIRWGFWMSLLTFTRAILAQIGLFLKRWVLLWCSYVMFAANISISIVLFFLMQVWRWSHSGKVCSGDYLGDDEDPPEGSTYLIFEGKFIKAMLIAIYCILSLSTLSVCIVSVCVYQRHSREDRERREAGVPDEEKPIRQSAFTRALDPDYEHAMRETARSMKKKKSEDALVTAAPEESSLLR